MLSLASVLIFTVVLFFYLHIQFHLKTSNDLEVYELDGPSKETLEEICDLRQPTRLTFSPEQLRARLGTAADTYGAFDVKVRDCKAPVDEDEDPYVPLRLDQAIPVMDADKEGRYFTESNADFLAETGLLKTLRAEDPFLRPYMVASCDYDYLVGSVGVRTPLRHEVANRTYLIVLTGRAHLKLAPPKTSRYLYAVNDYCNYEFRSPINPWDPQPQYRGDFDKVKCLDVTLEPGTAFFIPARWWYSMEFAEPRTQVALCRYATYMSMLATSPHTVRWALQTQNVQHRLAANLESPLAPPPEPVALERKSVPNVQDGPARDEGDGPPQAAQAPSAEAEHHPPPCATVASSSVPVSAVAS